MTSAARWRKTLISPERVDLSAGAKDDRALSQFCQSRDLLPAFARLQGLSVEAEFYENLQQSNLMKHSEAYLFSIPPWAKDHPTKDPDADRKACIRLIAAERR